MKIYKVQRGETLFSIARKFNTSPSLITRDNGEDCVYRGARLLIRESRVAHVVKPFEKLCDLAGKYAVSEQNIIEENGLSSSFVYVGQTLIIPEKKDEKNI